jgi:hypothetical protein
MEMQPKEQGLPLISRAWDVSIIPSSNPILKIIISCDLEFVSFMLEFFPNPNWWGCAKLPRIYNNP